MNIKEGLYVLSVLISFSMCTYAYVKNTPIMEAVADKSDVPLAFLLAFIPIVNVALSLTLLVSILKDKYGEQ